ncbi:hypothetical protein SS50377_24088 [Spironucleus salmonicida]|uniref:Uncharacterized protein n=1 Tax=Spironucleus salmonicida TaxID=348837 RepID=V6LZK5_9EUKA|nr:hypothetical protein SS50377_24088 [Spironucleus salmonicida]|eukprot:EST46274.1 Hypothetical protein SS50377_13708 [Spironucleus salmonicida]
MSSFGIDQYNAYAGSLGESSVQYYKIKNILFNSAFYLGPGQSIPNQTFDDDHYFTNIQINSIYFLGNYFDKDNINGLSLYHAAYYFSPTDKFNMYLFYGDLQFTRMFILGHLLQDATAQLSSQIMFTFHLIKRNCIYVSKDIYQITIDKQTYHGQMNVMCQRLYQTQVIIDKYKLFIELVLKLNEETNNKLKDYKIQANEYQQYTKPIKLSLLQDYYQTINRSIQLQTNMNKFNTQNVNVISCVNIVDVQLDNSVVNNMDIKQSCNISQEQQ